MSGFTAAWLALREAEDRRSRSRELARRFAAALPPAPRIVDLGAGTGATVRALAPILRGAPHWLLVERDAALRSDAPGRMTRVTLDLARGWPRLDALQPDGVTASAFLDLASAAWLRRLAAWLAVRRLPFLAALTVDGRRVWSPADPADAVVASAFRRHQRRDKGLGPALGPAAAPVLARLLAARGFAVRLAPSDWSLGPRQRELLSALVAGEAEAARAAAPGAALAIDGWAERRLAAAGDGRLAVRVGHRDLLALPRQIWEKGAPMPGTGTACAGAAYKEREGCAIR